MSRRNLLLLAALLGSAGIAVYFHRDRFKSAPVQIAYMVRPATTPRNPTAGERNPASGKPGYNVTFAFNQELLLTDVRVFTLEDARTNKYPYAIWHLTSDSNSVPVKSIVYGARIRGMRLAVKGATADPLEAGASYRLVIKAGDREAERDFQIPR